MTAAPPPVLAIVGPTGVGKTAVAVEVCRRAGGEIISVDSRQVFWGLEISSNAPTVADLKGVACHLVGVLDPTLRVNAARYLAIARPVLDDVLARGRLAVITAGTGLYLRALVDGLDLGDPPPPAEVRARLAAEARQDLPALVERLRDLDPAAAAAVDVYNPARVVRRMETALSQKTAGRAAAPAPVPAIKVGLTAPRGVLYRWIEERTDRMLSRGWRDEVARLLASGVDLGAQAFTGIGLAELAASASGRMAIEDARAVILQRTRNYAKRQLTWFRGDPAVRWIDVTVQPVSDIVDEIVRSASR